MGSRGTSVGTFVGGTQLGTCRIWRVEEKSKELNLKITFPSLAAGQPAPCLGSENLKTKQKQNKKGWWNRFKGREPARWGIERGRSPLSCLQLSSYVMRKQTESPPLSSSFLSPVLWRERRHWWKHLLPHKASFELNGVVSVRFNSDTDMMTPVSWRHSRRTQHEGLLTESSFLAVWCSASHLTSLTLSILFCKVAAGIGNTSSCDCED